MGNFFIAIGGTGQMAALGYLRLAKLCGFQPAQIYLMDRDDSGPLSAELRRVLGAKTIPTISPITPDEHITTFSTIFGNPPTQEVEQVLSVLFTPDQLETSVKKGMYGCPPVGATALMAKIQRVRQKIEDDPALRDLINRLRQAENQRVVVCGSVMGGTGAGGVPTLAKYIKQNAQSQNIQRQMKITIVDFLKWFCVQDEETDQQLERNTQSGIFYLNKHITQHVDACVLLGHDQPSLKVVEYQDIGEQDEVKHFINLFAAVILTNSLHIKEYANLFQTPNAVYAYSIPDNGEIPEKLEVYLPDDNSPHKPGKVSLAKIMKMAHAVSAYLGAFARYLEGGPEVLRQSFTPWAAIPPNLCKAFECFMSGGNKSEKQAWEEVQTNIVQKQAELDECIAWFEGLQADQYFTFEPKDITLSGKSYERVKTTIPMPFLRAWMARIDVTNWTHRIERKGVDGFVDEMIIALRKLINKRYLKSDFGAMAWLAEQQEQKEE